MAEKEEMAFKGREETSRKRPNKRKRTEEEDESSTCVGIEFTAE